MKGKLMWSVFWLLVVDFMVCLLGFIPAVARLMMGAGFLLVFALFILLGIALIVLTVRGKVAGLLGKSLILTGAAPVAVVIIFVLAEIIGSIIPGALQNRFGNYNAVDLVLFVIMAVFLVGVVGSIVLARRQGKQATRPS